MRILTAFILTIAVFAFGILTSATMTTCIETVTAHNAQLEQFLN